MVCWVENNEDAFNIQIQIFKAKSNTFLLNLTVYTFYANV